MAIIYTYPTKGTPANSDLILISDSADNNKTKQVKIEDLPGVSAAGVSSITISHGTSTGVADALEIDSPTGAVTITTNKYDGGSNVGYVPDGGSNTTFLRGDGAWASTALVIEDEGVQIAATADKINFTGVGVTASAVGNDITVNIPDQFVIEDIQLASAVSKGTALYISGPAHGSGRPTVDIADATDSTKMPVVGLALDDYIAGEGKMIVTGILSDFNTTAIVSPVIGKAVYVDNSGVDQNLTSIAPTGTDLIQNVGILTKTGANGSLQVNAVGRVNAVPNIAASTVWGGNASGVATAVTINKYDVLMGASASPVTSSGSTDAIQLPTGTTAEQPSPATNGLIRYNTTDHAIEAYIDGAWETLAIVP